MCNMLHTLHPVNKVFYALHSAYNMFCVPCQEVITHEHVVAMMKDAIRDTQDLPMFVSLLVSLPCRCLKRLKVFLK